MTFSQPAWAGDLPDPFVLALDAAGRRAVEGRPARWLAFGTGSEADGRVLQLVESEDFETWHPLPGPLVPPAGSEGCGFWAPEAAVGEDGRYYLYYSFGRVDEQAYWHQLRVAVADDPAGPYHDTGTPLIDPQAQQFAIDAHPFRDEDGTWWLFYAQDYPQADADAHGRWHAGTGLAVDRLIDMTRLAGRPTTVLRARHPWTLFAADRPMPAYGTTADWHTLEGPCVYYRDGRYWLMFSGNAWTSDRYGVDWATAEHVTGPYTGESADGPRLLSAASTALPGPGHHSITLGPDGRDWIAFHAWDSAHTARRMHLAPLEWREGGPRLNS